MGLIRKILCLRFNSQPPEGGWPCRRKWCWTSRRFQLTAARRRLAGKTDATAAISAVSTHSRPKAAGRGILSPRWPMPVSTHSRPKAAGRLAIWLLMVRRCCFNSQPPEGGWLFVVPHSWLSQEFQLTAARRRLGGGRHIFCLNFGFNSQPPEGGWDFFLSPSIAPRLFQLTAARRRLVLVGLRVGGGLSFQLTAARRRLGGATDRRANAVAVSTHSRPKAAGCWQAGAHQAHHRFNSQPPEGGWGLSGGL